ncbi:orotate phosphoribosyltransferase [Pacificimonas sp. ICDLI1SI03]
MIDEEVLAEFRAAGALLEGHFILSSGLRSPTFLQCARVLMDPKRAARLTGALALKIPYEVREQISVVISPAMGGILAGYEMARVLGVDSMFVERPSGTFELRRGFDLQQGQKVFMMEDVVTTGLSSREAIAAIEAAGGEVVAGGCLVDRSNGKADIGVPLYSLLAIEVPTYEASDVPPELAAIEPVKPGSRSAGQART